MAGASSLANADPSRQRDCSRLRRLLSRAVLRRLARSRGGRMAATDKWQGCDKAKMRASLLGQHVGDQGDEVW